MKSTVTATLLFVTPAFVARANAEASAPHVVIDAFVESLQSNKLEALHKYADLNRIQKQSGNRYSVRKLKALFAKVDRSQMQFAKPDYDRETETISMKMSKPLSLNFELQHQNSALARKARDRNQISDFGKGDFYLIIGIHPSGFEKHQADP